LRGFESAALDIATGSPVRRVQHRPDLAPLPHLSPLPQHAPFARLDDAQPTPFDPAPGDDELPRLKQTWNAWTGRARKLLDQVRLFVLTVVPSESRR